MMLQLTCFRIKSVKEILIYLIFRYNHIYEKNTINYSILKHFYIS